MNHRQSIAAVARKLRQFTQHDVSDMLEVLAEVWGDELQKPGGFVRIEGLGKLHVEQQTLRTPAAVHAAMLRKRPGQAVPPLMRRTYFRFAPARSLHRRIATQLAPIEEHKQ